MDKNLSMFFLNQPEIPEINPQTVIVLNRMGIHNFDQFFDLPHSKDQLQQKIQDFMAVCRGRVPAQIRKSDYEGADMAIISELTQNDVEAMAKQFVSMLEQGRVPVECLANFIVLKYSD